MPSATECSSGGLKKLKICLGDIRELNNSNKRVGKKKPNTGNARIRFLYASDCHAFWTLRKYHPAMCGRMTEDHLRTFRRWSGSNRCTLTSRFAKRLDNTHSMRQVTSEATYHHRRLNLYPSIRSATICMRNGRA